MSECDHRDRIRLETQGGEYALCCQGCGESFVTASAFRSRAAEDAKRIAELEAEIREAEDCRRLDRERFEKAEAESESRRKTLLEKADLLTAEWKRAEKAEEQYAATQRAWADDKSTSQRLMDLAAKKLTAAEAERDEARKALADAQVAWLAEKEELMRRVMEMGAE